MDQKRNSGNSTEILRKRIGSSLWVDEGCTIFTMVEAFLASSRFTSKLMAAF
jgi:hypothetical protein